MLAGRCGCANFGYSYIYNYSVNPRLHAPSQYWMSCPHSPSNMNHTIKIEIEKTNNPSLSVSIITHNGGLLWCDELIMIMMTHHGDSLMLRCDVVMMLVR